LQYFINDINNIIEQSHNQGIIFVEDFKGIVTELFFLLSDKKIEIYTRAVIKGKVSFYIFISFM
jgi:hypothetical protein